MAVSSTESGLLPLSQAAVYLMHLTTYIDYEFFEDDVFAEKFKKTLGNHDIVISNNHGYYALGRTAAEAFFRAYFLRQACSVQLKVMYIGDKIRLRIPSVSLVIRSRCTVRSITIMMDLPNGRRCCASSIGSAPTTRPKRYYY